MLGLKALRDILIAPTTSAVTTIDLMYNRIGEAGALILLEAVESEGCKIKECLVDLTLPLPLFERLYKKNSGKKGGKKKKAGKKK